MTEILSRPYSTEDVERLRGSVRIEHTLARLGAERLRELLATREWVPALGALTGGQAVQMVKAGLEAIYLSGWQVAADANLVGGTYPDQSLYPASSGPALARRINNALLRADQIAHAEDDDETYWLAPIVADAEAGFGGPLNAFELMKQMIEAGAAGVHFEDQLASEKKCGHLGGKVLVPTQTFVRTLNAARLGIEHDPLYVNGNLAKPLEFQAPALVLEGNVTADRLRDRRRLLTSIDTARRDFEAEANVRTWTRQQERAVSLLASSRTTQAFDVSQEPAELRARYGETANGI